MSLQEIEVIHYQVKCDCCGKASDATYPDPGDAVEGIPDEWMTIEAEQMCGDCWDWEEDTPYADKPVPSRCHHPAPPGDPFPYTPRLRSCVEAWPECEEGEYHPSCCRFPKSCSCTVYDPDRVSPEDLEEVPTWVSMKAS